MEWTRGGSGRVSRRGILTIVASTAVVAFAAAAGGTAAAGTRAGQGDKMLEVATTVAPITSIFANIGGTRVKVTGVVPEGTNSHTFEPKPSAAVLLSSVDVVYINGMKLEDPTADLARENLKSGAAIVEISKVLARPGTPTTSACPLQNMLISSCSTTASWPTMIFATSPVSVRNACCTSATACSGSVVLRTCEPVSGSGIGGTWGVEAWGLEAEGVGSYRSGRRGVPTMP